MFTGLCLYELTEEIRKSIFSVLRYYVLPPARLLISLVQVMGRGGVGSWWWKDEI